MIFYLKENQIPSNIIESYAPWLYKTIRTMVDDYVNGHKESVNDTAENILNNLQYNFIKMSISADCAKQD